MPSVSSRRLAWNLDIEKLKARAKEEMSRITMTKNENSNYLHRAVIRDSLIRELEQKRNSNRLTKEIQNCDKDQQELEVTNESKLLIEITNKDIDAKRNQTPTNIHTQSQQNQQLKDEIRPSHPKTKETSSLQYAQANPFASSTSPVGDLIEYKDAPSDPSSLSPLKPEDIDAKRSNDPDLDSFEMTLAKTLKQHFIDRKGKAAIESDSETNCKQNKSKSSIIDISEEKKSAINHEELIIYHSDSKSNATENVEILPMENINNDDDDQNLDSPIASDWSWIQESARIKLQLPRYMKASINRGKDTFAAWNEAYRAEGKLWIAIER